MSEHFILVSLIFIILIIVLVIKMTKISKTIEPIVYCTLTVNDKEYLDVIKDSISPPILNDGFINFKNKNGLIYHLKCTSYTIDKEYELKEHYNG